MGTGPAARDACEYAESIVEALRESTGAVIVRDMEDRITFWNRGAEEQYGWEADEAIGKIAHVLLQTRFPKSIRDIQTELFTRGSWEGELVHVGRDGTHVNVASRWVLQKNALGNAVGIFEINSDISVRKDAERKFGEYYAKLEERVEERTRELARLAAIVESSDDVIFRKGLDGIIETWNKAAERTYGYTAEEAIGRHVSMLVPPGHPDEIPAIMEKIKRGERVERYETVRVRKDGRQIHISLSVFPINDPNGRTVAASTIAHDITERKKREEKLKRWGEIFKNIRIGVVVGSTAEAKLKMINPAFAEMHGYKVEELIGRPISDVFAPGEKANVPDMIRMADEKGYYSLESMNVRKDGAVFPAQLDINSVKDEKGDIQYRIFNVQDIAERKKAEEKIKYQAYHDPLTDLANRAMLVIYLNLEIAQARREQKKLAVLFIDLDRFKSINDSLGHAVGDRLIKEAAERIRALIAEADTVAHFGGDEFGVLLADLQRAEDAAYTAGRILEEIRKPFRVDARDLFVTASIGISICPNDGEDAETLIRCADIAMSQAKEQGRNNYQFFDPSTNIRTVERLILESNLRQSVERGQLVILYQPLVDIGTGRITCLEALVRWRHPELGILKPTQFIPIAEEIGFVSDIDKWVFYNACKQARALQDSGMPPVCVTVNLSTPHFLEPDMKGKISRVLSETGLDPRHLDIEITESTAIRALELAVPSMTMLRELGVGLSIDDFGTGYSSLSYLKRFPVQKLKIDQSFIRGVATDPDDQAIVNATIAMGHSLKLKVVAEGVETEEQLAFLRSSRCDEMQGYLFSEPLPADKLEELVFARR
ncbi:MAG TPA: EAL domain-containing protein [Dissulfurispiraceae bacterium]